MGNFYIVVPYFFIMKIQKQVLVNQKGMITIPRLIRKKYKIQPGTEVAVVELEGVICIIPIRDIETTRNISVEEFEKSIDESRVEELELENNAKNLS